MMQQSSSCTHLCSEKGMVMALAPFLLVGLLAVAGLAVDAGNVYRGRLALQKALDAAVLGGIGYTIQFTSQERGEIYGSLPESNPATGEIDNQAIQINRERDAALIEERAEQIFFSNLQVSPVEPGATRVTFTYDYQTRTLRASADADLDLLLLDAIPWSVLSIFEERESALLRATAAAQRPKANIGLVLDGSGSMYCPAENPDCSCKRDVDACQGEELKIDRLAEAVSVFARHFDVEDNLGIVVYSMRARSIPPQQVRALLANQQLEPDIVRCVLEGQGIAGCNGGAADAGSATNACDAMMTIYDVMKATTENAATDSEEISYLYFSDGAPTAGRFLFTNPSGLPGNNPGNQAIEGYPGGIRDYTHWSVEWVPQEISAHPNYFGPSLLVKSQSLAVDWPTAFAPEPSYTGQHVPTCHSFTKPDGMKHEVYSPNLRPRYNDVFLGCLNDFSFITPDGVQHRPELSLQEAGAGLQWPKLYFQCGVAMSDMLRRGNGTVYSIGLGAAAPLDPENAFQNWFDGSSLKEQFLSRVAADVRFMTEIQQEQGLPPLTDDWQLSGIDSYDSWDAAPSNPRFGEYYRSPTSGELSDLFRRVATRILLRLVD